jgi:hypothetical protein
MGMFLGDARGSSGAAHGDKLCTEFLRNVVWGELDCLIPRHLPPGTSDAQLGRADFCPLLAG